MRGRRGTRLRKLGAFPLYLPVSSRQIGNPARSTARLIHYRVKHDWRESEARAALRDRGRWRLDGRESPDWPLARFY